MRLKSIICFLFCWLLIGLTGCVGEDQWNDSDDGAFISLVLRSSSAGINEDKQLWEDLVTEVRMIVSDQSGDVVYNGMLKFSNGLDNQCDAIKIYPGIYNFYFFANESAYSGFSEALSAVISTSQLQTDSRFYQLQYNPGFIPNAILSSGRFLMSSSYRNIEVLEGGTMTNPKLLQFPTQTQQVELIRSLAKVEVVFRKKISGTAIPSNSIASVQLTKVAGYYAIPPIDSYYTGQTTSSNPFVPANFNYNNDSIGSTVFYIPEFLTQSGSSDFTELHINSLTFPIKTEDMSGLGDQLRNIPNLSNNCVIRNFHYKFNVYITPQGGVEVKVSVEPWVVDSYMYMFQDPSQPLSIPPVVSTDSSVIIPTSCGKIEIRSNNEYLSEGLLGAYDDVILWWDPAIQGPNIVKGQPPCDCEKKYGPGWRLINSCELMSFLALFDQAYRVWHSNTNIAASQSPPLPFYPLDFRQQAQILLGKLTGMDMSKYVLSDTGKDNMGDEKLGIIDAFFTPGDIMVTLKQYPGGWPYYPAPPISGIENWFPMEVVLQVKGYWYSGYLKYDNPANYNSLLYQRFERYNFSSTVSRCVRSVE